MNYIYIFSQDKVNEFKKKDFKNVYRVLDFTNERQGDLRARKIFLNFAIDEEKENLEAFKDKRKI